jgi:hypothetical protein
MQISFCAILHKVEKSITLVANVEYDDLVSHETGQGLIELEEKFNKRL